MPFVATVTSAKRVTATATNFSAFFSTTEATHFTAYFRPFRGTNNATIFATYRISDCNTDGRPNCTANHFTNVSADIPTGCNALDWSHSQPNSATSQAQDQ